MTRPAVTISTGPSMAAGIARAARTSAIAAAALAAASQTAAAGTPVPAAASTKDVARG